MKRALISFVVVSMLVVGCAAFKATVRTIDQIAFNLCLSTASDYSDMKRDGMSVKDWCKVQANLHPFVQWVTSAKADLAEETGLTGAYEETEEQ